MGWVLPSHFKDLAVVAFLNSLSPSPSLPPPLSLPLSPLSLSPLPPLPPPSPLSLLSVYHSLLTPLSLLPLPPLSLPPSLPIPRKSRRTSDQAEDYPVILKGSSLLSSEMEELSGVYYRPRTRETKSTYEILLSFIHKMIGDQVCSTYIDMYVCVCMYVHG